MTHHYICNYCKHENKVSVQENDRGDFQMQKGDFLKTDCVKCLKTEKTHINDIYGKESKNIVIGGFILGMSITILLLFIHPNVWIISAAFITIPTLVFAYQNNLVKTFNHYRVKRK